MFSPWIFLRENEGKREPVNRQFVFLQSYLLRASPAHLTQEAVMLISRFIFVYLGLLVFLSLACFFLSYNRFTSKFECKPSLHELADRLHDAGLEFRVLSPRQDGLASNAIYLTQTDLDDVSIRSLALDS